MTFALDWTLRRGADTFCPLNEQQGKHQGRELPDVGSHGRTSRLQRPLQPQSNLPIYRSYSDFYLYNNDVIVFTRQKKMRQKLLLPPFPSAEVVACEEKAGKRSSSPLGRFSVLIGCFCSSQRRADDPLQNIGGGNAPCRRSGRSFL